MGIPTFFPSGNGRDYKRIDWPACLDESISVGYVDQQNEISVNSNNDIEKLDFFAPGFFTVPGVGNIAKNISGSSASIQVAGAQWIQLKSANPSYTYDQLLNAFRSTTSSTVGRQGTFNKLININGALAYKPVAVGPTPAELAAQKAASDAAAKVAAQTALKAEIDKAIAVAQAEYDATVKAAADKLAAYKSAQLARLNG
jgi:hypothetical protein